MTMPMGATGMSAGNNMTGNKMAKNKVPSGYKHGQLQQFADIGLILNGRHLGDGLVQCLGERLEEIRPLNATNAAGGWRSE